MRALSADDRCVSELFELSAASLAARIHSGKVSSREVVQAHLDRIEALNGYLGALTNVLGESALSRADACDRGDVRGPLCGVPFTVKENLDCLGSATTHGLPGLRDALPYADAPAVARLKAAGAILIARANLSEMGLRLCTSNPLHGRTLNPYDRRLTVGGSSGGDAAAVATGMTPLGLGSDIGGSLRVPAQTCGVFSLKPTTGRIACAGSLPPLDHGLAGQLMLAVGPITRFVADLRLGLSVMAGRDHRDPRSADVPLAGPAPLARRAALVTELPFGPLEPSIVRAVRRAGELLQAAGWEVAETLPPELARVNEVFSRILAADLAIILPQSSGFISPGLCQLLERLVRAGNMAELSSYRAHVERSRLMRAWSGFFQEYPVLIGPNWGRSFWRIDADLEPETSVSVLQETVRFITPGNVLGIPSVSVPMGLVEGLPSGVQIYADAWREDLCLAAAEVIEAGVQSLSPVELSSILG